jgi:hypothetical protein
MKKITWNRLHNWKKTSQLWHLVEHLDPEKDQRRIKILAYPWTTPWKNVLWYLIEKEFAERFETFKMYEHHDIMQWEVYICTSVHPLLEYGIKYSVNGTQYLVRPPGNMEYTPENIRGFVLAQVEAMLYPKGSLLRMVQMIRRCSKLEAAQWYKERLWMGVDKFDFLLGSAQMGRRRPVEMDETLIERKVKRRFNVDVSAVGLEAGIEWIRKHGRQDKEVYLCRFDFSFANRLDGDIDELESEYWEEVQTYPGNAMFI